MNAPWIGGGSSLWKFRWRPRVIPLIGSNNANIARRCSNSVRNGGWRPGTRIPYYYLRERRGLPAVILRRDRLRKPGDLCSARFLVTSSTKYPPSPRLFSRSPSERSPLVHPLPPFRPDFLPRKWIFMKDVNNERDNFLFASHSCLQRGLLFPFLPRSPHFSSREFSNHIVSVCFVPRALFALSATSRRMRRIRFARREAPRIESSTCKSFARQVWFSISRGVDEMSTFLNALLRNPSSQLLRVAQIIILLTSVRAIYYAAADHKSTFSSEYTKCSRFLPDFQCAAVQKRKQQPDGRLKAAERRILGELISH